MTYDESKKEAIFQLCNFLCCHSVGKITDLANGEILFKTIAARFPHTVGKVQSNEEYVLRDNAESNDESGHNLAIKEQDIFLQHIKKFIDDHYNIRSEAIIDYENIINFDEFEIMKMSAFVLSEVVKKLFETNSEDLCTLYHFESKFQVELRMMFNLFISEREKINKDEVEKLLSRPSKNVSLYATPRRTSARHKDKRSDSPNEDIFSNSPLKEYFESPVFKKEHVWIKEKVKCYEKTLQDTDEEILNLEHKITKLEEDLKNREKQSKYLQMKCDEKEKIIINLQRDVESLKAQQESVLKDLTLEKRDSVLLTNRLTELNNQIDHLQRALIKEEENTSVKKRKSSLLLYENSLLKSKDEEIATLKDKVKKLETKQISYKKELAAKILSELQDKKPPGNRTTNSVYEDAWFLENLDRSEREELLSTIIIADNRDLSKKLNIAQQENEQLLKEIENLKKMLVGKNKKSRTTKFKDTSKTPEIERLRKSSNETSFSSDYLIPHEQSVIASESDGCCENTSEAVLWKMYDSQKSESESTYDINLNHDFVITENSNLSVINDSHLSNIKVENLESDSLLNQENKCVLGNLNFDAFFNELKKLTKNGSFQKVLQVFGRRQKEINGTNKCVRLDLQEMLKMITECVCLVVTLNAESSANLEDKCCSTDEKELCTVIELNIQLNKLKNQLIAAAQKHEIDLKACKNELDEYKKEKIELESKYQTSTKDISDRKRAFEDLCRKYREQIYKNEILHKKCVEFKKLYEDILDKKLQQRADTSELKKISWNNYRKRRYYEHHYNIQKKENSKLKTDLQELKEENEKLLKEKASGSISSVSVGVQCSLISRKSWSGFPNDLGTKHESSSATFQDTSNENELSGAFHKSMSHYVSENEDDFCYYNSLNPMKKEYDTGRIKELQRRNSLYPRQMQSSYPLEADLNTTYHRLYVEDESYHYKKRKLETAIIEEQPTSPVTPISKLFQKYSPPPSLQRLFTKRVKSKITVTPNIKLREKYSSPSSLQRFMKRVKPKKTMEKNSS